VNKRISPSRKNCIIDVLDAGDIESQTEDLGALKSDIAKGVVETGIVVLNDGFRDETGCELVFLDENMAPGKGTHVLRVVIVVRIELRIGYGMGNGFVSENRDERCEDGFDLVRGFVVAGYGVDEKEGRADYEDDHGAGVDHVGEEACEFGDDGVECFLCGVGGGELETSTSNLDIWVGLDGHGDDDSVGSSTASAECPVEIRVLFAGCSYEFSVSGDNIEAESLICCKTERGTVKKGLAF
jgi:hypothetical protein